MLKETKSKSKKYTPFFINVGKKSKDCDISYDYDKKVMKKTQLSIRDMMVEGTRSEISPVYFAKNRMGIDLFDNQIELVKAICDFSIKRVASLQARQGGKSFSVATAITIAADRDIANNKDRGTLIGVFANKEAQSWLVRKKIEPLLKNNDYFKSRMDWNRCTKGELVWKSRSEGGTGSVIKFLSASAQAHIEGETFDIIILDESQKISDHVFEEAIIPMGGACVCEGTWLTDGSGNNVLVENFISKHIIGYKSPGAFVDDVVWLEKIGQKECYEIITNAGRTLRCSYDHPILIKQRFNRRLAWIETEKLKIGEQISILDECNFFGNKIMFDPRLVGMLIGDGSYGKRQMVKYSSCDSELLEYVKKYNFRSYNSYFTKLNKLFMDGVIPGLCEKLQELGIHGQVGNAKRLPNNIGEYSKHTICELLGGLFDTDGCVLIEENRRGKIELYSCSKDMLWEVFYLLEKFGVHSRIYFKKSSSKSFGKNGFWVLTISEKISIERFYKNISFLIKYKQEKLSVLINILKSHKSKRQKNIHGLYFERIISINPIGIQTVYNLTAKQEHNYIANGIVTHNTNAKIIQIGTPRRKNHFYNAVADPKSNYVRIIHDWTQCGNLWSDDATIINDRPYSSYVLSLMPFSLRSEIFPDNPIVNYRGKVMSVMDIPLEGGKGMSVRNFKTQYMLHWISDVDSFLNKHEFEKMATGDFEVLSESNRSEIYYAGIDRGGSLALEEDTSDDEDQAESHTSISIIRVTPNGLKQKVFHKFLPKDMDWVEQGKYFIDLFHPIKGKFFNVKNILIDMANVGKPVLDYMKSANLPIEGIVFNATEKDSRKNYKNAMYDVFQYDLQDNKWAYPKFVSGFDYDSKNELYEDMKNSYLQWEDLEAEEPKSGGINKKFKQGNSSRGDDAPNSDVLAGFANKYKIRPAKVRPKLASRI